MDAKHKQHISLRRQMVGRCQSTGRCLVIFVWLASFADIVAAAMLWRQIVLFSTPNLSMLYRWLWTVACFAVLSNEYGITEIHNFYRDYTEFLQNVSLYRLCFYPWTLEWRRCTLTGKEEWNWNMALGFPFAGRFPGKMKNKESRGRFVPPTAILENFQFSFLTDVAIDIAG